MTAGEGARGNGLDRRSVRGSAGILIVAALFPTAAAWIYFVIFATSPALPIIYTAFKLVQFLLPIGWVVIVERRRTIRTTPPSQNLAAGVWTGLAGAVCVAGFYLAAVRGGDLAAATAPRIAERIEALGAASPLRFMALALFLSVVHSFLEEYYWRWFLFDRMSDHLSGRAALALSSLAFTAHHVIVLHAFTGSGRFLWVTVLCTIAVASAGGIWAWLFARSRSLLPGWLSHTLVDLAIMAIGYDLVRGIL